MTSHGTTRCFDLTRRSLPSFVGGMVWAFFPCHLTRALAAPNLASVEWLPFLALFLRRTLRGGGWASAAAANPRRRRQSAKQ